MGFLGAGHFRRNVAAHQAHVRGSALKMYGDCSLEIRATFEELWVDLSAKFDRATQSEMDRIVDEFDDLVEKFILNEKEVENESGTAAQKLQLSQEVLDAFSRLKIAWSNPGEEQEGTPGYEDEGDGDIPCPEIDFEALLDLAVDDSSSSLSEDSDESIDGSD